jgi:hypothetical protein
MRRFAFAPLRRPPPPLAKKFSVSVPFWKSKNVFGHTTIFPKYEKKFSETPKNFPNISNFYPKLKHFSRNPRIIEANPITRRLLILKVSLKLLMLRQPLKLKTSAPTST